MKKYRVSNTSTVSITIAFTRHPLSIDTFFSLFSMLKYRTSLCTERCSYGRDIFPGAVRDKASPIFPRILWDGSKGVINFPWILYAMRSLVPVGHFRNISGHLFTWLVCGSFQWRHGLLFTDCIVWDDKDEVIGFKRSHWIHLGWWSTGSPKLQLFQLSQHSHVINCWLTSSSAYFL